MFTYLLHKGAD